MFNIERRTLRVWDKTEKFLLQINFKKEHRFLLIITHQQPKKVMSKVVSDLRLNKTAIAKYMNKIGITEKSFNTENITIGIKKSVDIQDLKRLRNKLAEDENSITKTKIGAINYNSYDL